MGLPKADVVLTGGRVFCGLAEGVSEALALWGGRVLATGSSTEMEPLIGPATKIIDLRGRLATPGLYEAHLHLLPLGLSMVEVDVRPRHVRTLEGLLERIRERAAQVKPGQWVIARGYDQFRLDVKRHPLREELDRAAPDHPVHLVRACGHISIVNSLALRLAGIDETTPVPPGGAIEQRDGKLTGFLAENGREAVRAAIPEADDEALVAAVDRAGRYCNSFGITSVMDAAVGSRAGYREIAAYRTAQRTKRLPVRTNQCLLGGAGGIVERAYADGLVTGAGDDRLTVGPVKIFTDGSAGGKTAAMTVPYNGNGDGGGGNGILCLEDREMRDLVADYHGKGFQLAIHAIGDAAIEQTLDALEAAQRSTPDPGRRHRIEHCGFIRPDQMERMAQMKIEPVPQPVFLYDYGDLYVSVVGEERAAASYPMRTWMNFGMKPAASSDAPVCDVDPFPNLYTMLTRKSSQGTILGGQETLTPAEAVAAYTEFGAYVNRAERHRGRLAPGLAADVAVFSRDLLTASPEEVLHDTRCDLTILDGEVVYDRAGEAA